MGIRFVLCALIFAAVAARAQTPSRVRVELMSALGARAAALAPQAPLRELISLFLVEEKPRAKVRLDDLDRTRLSPAELRELSEAYVLLGYFDAGAAAGRALQDREPSGTLGFKLAAMARLQEKDYAGAAESAREALKIDPQDRDAAALLYTARGRGVPSGSAPTGPAPPPSPGAQNEPLPRSPPVFTQRPSRGPTRLAVPPSVAREDETEGMISGGSKWMKRKVDESTQAIVKRIDRLLGLQPGEEAAALRGARYGGIAGAGAGAVGGGMLAGGVCAPALVTGAPYGACVVAGGAGGVLFGAPSGAYVGGLISVKYERVKADLIRIFGSSSDGSYNAE